MVVIENDSLKSMRPFTKKKSSPCVFEYIYFSRPDSVIKNVSIYEYRKKLGAELAKETHVDSDLIIPVPDSGVPASIGYAEKTKKNVVTLICDAGDKYLRKVYSESWRIKEGLEKKK